MLRIFHFFEPQLHPTHLNTGFVATIAALFRAVAGATAHHYANNGNQN